MSERLDSKGHRVGKRAFNGPGNLNAEGGKHPKRNEGGLAPGLEQTIIDAANYLEGLVASHHSGSKHKGHWTRCEYDCGAWRAPAETLREGLAEWAGRLTMTNIGPFPTPPTPESGR